MTRPWIRVRKATVFDETTVDPTRAALDAAANRLINAKATLDAVLERTRHRHYGATMTRAELVAAFRDQLLEVYADVIGVKTS